MLPNVDNQDLAGRQRKEGALALKVLVLTPFAPVGALDVHDENVVGHARARVGGALALQLVLGQPDALGGLAPLEVGHDAELGAEQVVEQGRLAGGLGAEDGDEMVVEAGIGDAFEGEVLGEVGAAVVLMSVGLDRETDRRQKETTDLNCLSSSMTCTPCS